MRRLMNYLTLLLIGLGVVASLLSAGAIGYALAHARNWRRAMIAACCGLTLAYGASVPLLASVVYTRLAQPSLTAATQTQPTSTQTQPPTTQTEPPSATAQQSRPATDAWLRFQSDSGDFIGAGKSELWTLAESNFTVSGDSRDIRATASGKGDEWWLEFRAPSNGTLQVGTFTKAERAPFVTGKAPGLDIYGSGRGCNTLSGQFGVKSLKWTSSGTIAEIDVVFEQHCEGGSPALRGELWITTQVGVHKAPPDMSTPI